MTIASPTVPDLEAERARLLAESAQLLDSVTAQGRDLTPAEGAELRTKGDAIDRIDEILNKIAADQRRARFAGAIDPGVERGHARIGAEPPPTARARAAPTSAT